MKTIGDGKLIYIIQDINESWRNQLIEYWFGELSAESIYSIDFLKMLLMIAGSGCLTLCETLG